MLFSQNGFPLFLFPHLIKALQNNRTFLVYTLQIPSAFNGSDGTNVYFAAFQEVINDAQDAHPKEHDQGPIKRFSVHWRFVGPKGPEESEGDIGDSDHVNGYAEPAETPARGREELRVVDTTVQYAAHGDAVSEHEGDNLERDDSVKCHVGPNIDEREQGADQTREQHRVGRDLPGWVHGRDPARKGQAVIARKGKRLTRGRRVERHVAGHHEHEHHDGECVDPARRHGLVEDVNKREAGLVVEGVLNRWDREEIRDHEDKRQNTVADITPHNRQRYVAARVFDFFRHVGRRIGA